MIAIICAMSEERDALISLMSDVKTVKFESFMYHGQAFDNKCYKGNLNGKQVVVGHCGVGKVYAAIITALMLKKFKPELVINLGCAGSLNKDVHVNDVVVATRVADWDVEVPGWARNMYSDKMSFACDGSIIKVVNKLKLKNVHTGLIVSGDEFIYKKSQVNTIKKYFGEALCGEMEGCSIANTCYAFGVNCTIIRSISDSTLVSGGYKDFDFNLKKVCDTAAKICAKIVKNCHYE